MIKEKFWLGEIRKIHKIGKGQVIEYHPHIYINNCGTEAIDKKKIKYSVEKYSYSYDNIKEAILCALGGPGFAKYAFKMLK